MTQLLAVDLGLATGFALYGADGRLVRYRSTHFPSLATLKAALPKLVSEYTPLGWVVVEGDRHLGDLWEKQARRLGAETLRTSAEGWRPALLLERERDHGGERAKRAADTLARKIIDWSGAARPTSLRHDVAEAICIGLWGAIEVGLLPAMPSL